MKFPIAAFILPCLLSLGLSAQHYPDGASWRDGDSTHRSTNNYHRPKYEKGPKKGHMLSINGLKVEMVPPSGDKGNDVVYFLYDSLNKAVEATLYSGTVKYVFGGPNEYLETKLNPLTHNKYIATLEGWQEYKRAIVTLKADGKTYTFPFVNSTSFQQNQACQGNSRHHGHGGHGGSYGGGNRMGGGLNNNGY